ALIGLYLGQSTKGAPYGAAGALVILLLWIYYSAQIFLLGAEFTQVYAGRYGRQVMPGKNAVAMAEGHRAQEGLTRDPERHPSATPQNAITLGVQTQPAVQPRAPTRV